MRQLRLGQELYFVLWDEDADFASVAKGEVVQYASDWSKVRVKVTDAPQSGLVGRTSWILPDRLDDDAAVARLHYQRRARTAVREEMEEGAPAPGPAPEEAADQVAGEGARLWAQLCEAWADVDLLIDTMDFEAGWPENQARLAKFGVMAVLRLGPDIERLVAMHPDSDAARAVSAALGQGVLGTARRLAADDPAAILARWNDVPFEEVGEAGDTLAGLRTALAAFGEAADFRPALSAAAAL